MHVWFVQLRHEVGMQDKDAKVELRAMLSFPFFTTWCCSDKREVGLSHVKKVD